MTIGPRPICMDCKHLRPYDPEIEAYTCDAYPEGIPFEIIANHIQHDKPYIDDNGIIFEAKES